MLARHAPMAAHPPSTPRLPAQQCSIPAPRPVVLTLVVGIKTPHAGAHGRTTARPWPSSARASCIPWRPPWRAPCAAQHTARPRERESREWEQERGRAGRHVPPPLPEAPVCGAGVRQHVGRQRPHSRGRCSDARCAQWPQWPMSTAPTPAALTSLRCSSHCSVHARTSCARFWALVSKTGALDHSISSRCGSCAKLDACASAANIAAERTQRGRSCAEDGGGVSGRSSALEGRSAAVRTHPSSVHPGDAAHGHSTASTAARQARQAHHDRRPKEHDAET